ncbi:MAG: RtcB family protein, partial [Desulfovibrio sp.]|nr:RtcB family protein [Desulfovibrio sp.]
YAGELEAVAMEQIRAVCDREEFADCKIRIMPDVHAGMGCVIGTTMTITDKIVPGMVGVDIGCGMETVRLAENEIDYIALDNLIRREIPSGRDIRKNCHPLNDEIDLAEQRCFSDVHLERAQMSIGTLGGGNHFIEVDRSDNGELYLVIHSGSRHIGKEVASIYQDEAYRTLCGNSKRQIEETIIAMKEAGREREIADTIKRLKGAVKREVDSIPKDLAYVAGDLFDDYIHDMKIIQRFAVLNRQAMTDVILRGMGLAEIDRFTTIHNYIDTDSMILRKGSVSAKKDERLLLPINMRDGSVICIGKGNEEWNCSAPHGAGRLMSRQAAFKTLSMEEYAAGMSGIFTTSVSRKTLDESPMAYKNIDEILSHIGPTADVIERLLPVYNFKASE